ncbi:MAG: 50S ribosomal protein L25 [Actinobacteria bacterium]|nr:50S ribosomal protein L25 [Actinomycetota bacterium]
MSSSKLKISLRQDTGTVACGRLRARGLIPAVIYGHQQEALPVSISEHDLGLLLGHGARLLDISLDKKPEKALVKEVQYDHLGVRIIHVDLVRVSLDEKIQLEISIELRGAVDASSHGGGTVEQLLNQVEVECLASNIPEAIQIQVGRLKLGDEIRVKDLPVSPEVTVLSDPETLVVVVRAVVAEEAAEEPAEGEEAATDAAAEPEVIGRAAEEQDKDTDQEN